MARTNLNPTPLKLAFDATRIRDDFPILSQSVNGHPLVYLDNGATTQKPQTVIDAIQRYYSYENANIHRGVHTLSEQATEAFEGARETVRRFINATSTKEIVFTGGTTDGINLVAQSYVRTNLQPGDEILVLESEHHSNIVPWQILAEQRQTVLRYAPINDAGEVSIDVFKAALNERTKFVSIGHVSNALGTINPVKEFIALAHDVGAKVLIDGAQAMAHAPVDVQALNCDFYAFSGHKVFGPTGVGALYGREVLLEAMPPYQGGGDMIRSVSFEHTEYNDLPYKFEAGTPNIAGVIGLNAALVYLEDLDLSAALTHEHEVLENATSRLTAIDGITIVGTAAHKAGVLSFNLDGVHPHDLGTLLDHQGVAIRTGHHCAMPVMQHFGLTGTARASFALYNTHDDVDRFIAALEKARILLA